MNITTVASYLGFQEDGAGGGFELWNLKVEIPGHPAGSTVTRETILKSFPAGSRAIGIGPEHSAPETHETKNTRST